MQASSRGEPDAERRQWLFDTVEIQHIREVPSADVVEIVEELSHDFATVRTTRWNFIVGAGGPGFLEAAVVISILAGYAVAHAFLQELGRDAYRAVRGAIGRLYKQRGSLVTPHGRYLPLEIVAQGETELRFIVDEGLSPIELEEVIANLGSFCKEVLDNLAPDDEGKTIQFTYDSEKRSWERHFEMRFPERA